MSARQQFESQARKWLAEGMPRGLLLDGYSLIALRCWSFSKGAKSEGVSEELTAFQQASEQAQPENWLDAYFAEREFCVRCGESYRFENVSLCTKCLRTWCYRCAAGCPPAANGNAACSCGGELVG